MPSQRRLRVLTYLVLAGVVTLLFFTSQARHSRDADTRSLQDFYSKTVNAMGKGHAAAAPGQRVIADHDVDADGDIDDDDTALAREMAARLRQAEQKAKDNAKAKAPNKPEFPEEVIGVGSSAGGQKKPAPKGKPGSELEETEEDREVKAELNAILKKSPSITARAILSRNMRADLVPSSYHLLQIVLSLFQESQGNSARPVHH